MTKGSTVIVPMFSKKSKNYLLAALPEQAWAQFYQCFETVNFNAGHVLFDGERSSQRIYFPMDCVISYLSIFESGTSVEMATVGREGVVSVAGLLGRGTSAAQQTVQIPGSAVAISHKAFRRFREESVPFAILVDAFVEAFIAQLLRSVACNAVHSVEQRAGRWLLMCQDRVGKDTFPLTQEGFSALLGTARPTISIVSRHLRELGTIQYSRGSITIKDRDQLEKVACECYRTNNQDYDDALSRPLAAIADLSTFSSRVRADLGLATAPRERRAPAPATTLNSRPPPTCLTGS
jgi:CRP-like cAMP-binding protein